MAYAVLTDIQEQVPADVLLRLTDDEDAGAVDADRLDAAIAWADGRIDAYVGTRYPVPLNPVPETVTGLSVDLAVYRLYSRRAAVTDDVERAYKDAIAFLRDVAAGRATLGEDDPDGTPSEANAPDITSDTRLFSRDGLEGF